MLCLNPPNESLVRCMWELVAIGILHAAEPLAMHDEVMREFTRKVSHDGERYQVALPWNGKQVSLCDNRQSAETRLMNLR